MKDPMLDEDIINFYSEQRLSAHRLEILLEETHVAKGASIAREQRTGLQDRRVASTGKESLVTRCLQFLSKDSEHPADPFRARLAFVSFCLMAGLVWFSGSHLLGTGSGNANDLANLMLREAALNHQSKLQVEYDDSDLLALGKSMERLNFDLKVPADIADSHTLLGGRYCTLAGNLAVHLRLQPKHVISAGSNYGLDLGSDSAAERSVVDERSVFVTLANKELAALGDMSHVFPDKVSVESWQQGDLFYLIAESGSR